MTERMFRFILGASLGVLLLVQNKELIYAYIGILLFEGVTNWRVPILISKLRFGKTYAPTVPHADSGWIPLDAERILRILVASMLILSYVMFREQTWFFPWFIGFMLFMAGMTNICPMVMGLRWIGFR